MRRTFLLGAAVLAITSGCGDDDASTPDAEMLDAAVARDAATFDAGFIGEAGPPDAGFDAGVCNQVWIVESTGGPDVMVGITGGSLDVSARNIAAGISPIAVYQPNLSGDFEGGFFFEMFSPSGPGAYLQAVVGLGEDDYAVAGVGTLPVPGVGTAVFHPGMPPVSMLAPTAGTSGFMRFKRTGTMLEVTSVAMGEMATVMDTLTGDSLRIGIQIGNNGTDTVGGVVSVRVTEFRMMGGGGEVVSDSFDCDSLRR